MSLWPAIPPEQMTSRARWYLVIVCGYCLMMSLGLALLPHWFETPSFRVVIHMVPFQQNGWALLHLGGGVTAFLAGYFGSKVYAYRALIGASVVVGIWACGFNWAVVNSLRDASWHLSLQMLFDGRPGDALNIFRQTARPASWSAAVAYTSIVLIHIVQARQPLRSPFDPVLRRLDGK